MLQVDVTSKTEGKAFADATGVPLLVKYDTRLRDNVAKNIVQDVTTQVQVGHLCARPASSCRQGMCPGCVSLCRPASLLPWCGPGTSACVGYTVDLRPVHTSLASCDEAIQSSV